MDETARLTTVLFADISNSTGLYETAGDAAASEAIGRCLEQMRRATESAGGRVVKTIGDEIMALFPTPDTAAAAAAEMQNTIDQMAPVANSKIGLRIGFHYGPVVQKDGDVFGDTVNLASRLVEQAVKGQIITSADTTGRFGALFRNFTRRLYAIQVKGKAEEVDLCELVWKQSDDVTAFASGRPRVKTAKPSALRLVYRDTEIVRRRENDSIVLGRDTECGIVIADELASRQHCTVEKRGDKWVLKDHSTNGTYVTIAGDTELLLRREELTLRRRGWIAFGRSREGNSEVVEYNCE